MDNREPNLNRDNVWIRGDRDFAVRVEEHDIRGMRDAGLRVEEGTRALLLEDGKLVETLRAGLIDLKSHKGGLIWKLLRNPERLVVILTDDADARIAFTTDRLVTRDNRDFAITVELVFAIDQPAIFFKNFMRSRKQIYHDDFERTYGRQIEDALIEFAREKTMDDLGHTRDLKSDIAVSLDAHLSPRLKADGLKLLDVQSVRWTGKGLERLKRDRDHLNEIDDMLQNIRHAREDESVREKLHEFDIDSLEARLRRAREQTQVLEDDEFEKLRQEHGNTFRKLKEEVAEEEEAVPWRRKRLEQIRDWRRTMAEYETTEAAETFDAEKTLRKIRLDNEKNELFTQEELDDLQAELQVRALDRKDKTRARLTLTKKLELKEQMELELLELEKKYTVESETKKRAFDLVREQFDRRWSFEKQQLRHEIEMEELKAEKADIEWRRKLAKDKAIADQNRQKEMEDEEAKLALRLKDAKTDIEIKTLNEELEHLKDKHSLELLEIMDRQDERKQEMDRLDLEERHRIERENRIKNQMADLDAERIRMEIELKRLEAERKHELDRNAQLGDMPLEKIFALTREDAGDVIRRMKQDEYFKNMDPEQIKMVQLRDLPPHVAKMFEGELLKTQDQAHAAEIREILEQARRDERTRFDRDRDEMARDKRDFQDAMFRSRDTGERNIADIVKASKSDSGPVVVVPGQGGGAVYPVGGGQAAGGADAVDIRCPNCGVKITRRVNYCPDCGHKLLDH